jgi:hypothetical protein
MSSEKIGGVRQWTTLDLGDGGRIAEPPHTCLRQPQTGTAMPCPYRSAQPNRPLSIKNEKALSCAEST